MSVRQEREPGIGLALSGGGFRASLFMVGSLWRLNELGWLPQLNRITSVSGGSITSALLGMRWRHLEFDSGGVASNFIEEIAKPLQLFCSRTIDIPAVLQGILTCSINDRIADLYDRDLYHGATLEAFPDDEAKEGPRFVIYATNLQTTSSVRISRHYLADYRIGELPTPNLSIAKTVGASSAFPPFLSPAVFYFDPDRWTDLNGAYLYSDSRYRRCLVLSDGGVYDNMGLENIWNRFTTVLVADAGAPTLPTALPWKNWLGQSLRTFDIVTEQARSVRKRKLIGDFEQGICEGTYWGIATQIDDYELPNAMVKDNDTTRALKTIRTRLNKFSPKEQGLLINWGYALTDAAMRKHVLTTDPGPGQWPIPAYPL